MSIQESISSKQSLSKPEPDIPSSQEPKKTSESQQFTKDIVTEEFYVLGEEDETSAFEFETTTTNPKVSIQEPDKFQREEHKDEVIFDLTDDIATEDAEEQEPTTKKKKQQDAEHLEPDFFERDDLDAEKKQVVEEIAGMTEIAEPDTEASDLKISTTGVVDTKESEYLPPRTARRSIIQFKHLPLKVPGQERAASEGSLESESILEKVPSKKSIERDLRRRSSMTRRPSTIPELMKLSKKSLLALTSSAEASFVSKRSGEDKFAALKKEGMDMGMLSTLDFYSDPRASKGIQSVSESRRTTYYTELGPRYRQSDDDDMLEGFEMTVGDVPIFFEVLPEEEQEVVLKEEEILFKLERAPYYERHDKAAREIAILKIRNFTLHKKLSMYFKRKKMDYVTKETDWSFDGLNKYNKKLEAYGDLIDFIAFEKARKTQDLDETKRQKTEKFKKLTNMFKKMQDRECEIGYGLINTKTGNALPDKFVERLIRRQSTQMAQVSSMRLTFIRLKGMVQEQLDAIASLDEISPGFLLADFEQLKSDNRAYADKIEEKDEELTRLRAKCGSTIQVLAHLREKTAALDNDLEDLYEERDSLDSVYFDVRSRLNQQKQSRDSIRHALNKMRDESGLLTQPTLLKDMEQGLTEIKILTDQLSHVMKEHKKKATQIKTIRKKMEQTIDMRRGIGGRSLTRVQSNQVRLTIKKDRSSKVYKGRPSLMMPIIEENAFGSLKTIKPKLTYDRSHRNRSNIKHNKRKEG